MMRQEGTWRLVPRPRGQLPAYCAGAVAIVVLLGLCLWGNREFCKQVVIAGLGTALGALLQGVCLLAEESLHHLETRYHSSLPRMLRACFSKGLLLLGVISALVLCAGSLQLEFKEWYAVAMTIGFSLLLKAFGILSPSAVEISEICEQRKMNVAHGLAWSFYTGYLRLVLPRLEASIEEYHQRNGKSGILQQRDSRRLHILIPLSAFIPEKLEEMDTRVRFYANLPEIIIDKAGVRRRVYKHSVYSVQDHQGQVQHCVVECATPLQTLYHMSQDSSAGLSSEERCQQVLLFLRTLHGILEDSVECRNRFRLIILEDACEQEAEPDPHFLSKAILKQLRQEEREEYGVAPPLEGPGRGEPLSREPTLMISEDLPNPLRMPVETYDWSPTQDNCIRLQ
ncbi:stimulator of interferon genes protein [Conger conger]|uniref:stimulator of interferon genes protein n=1 Tax=Conger conger TaxID=82655 RepID=UPI002A5A4591|nr:stimulator of interferon genes protein [Conger conger]XP_061091415.1 stimulator of interferon genes protein [Conger conger]